MGNSKIWGGITFAFLGIFLIVVSMLTLWVYIPSTPSKNKERNRGNQQLCNDNVILNAYFSEFGSEEPRFPPAINC